MWVTPWDSAGSGVAQGTDSGMGPQALFPTRVTVRDGLGAPGSVTSGSGPSQLRQQKGQSKGAWGRIMGQEARHSCSDLRSLESSLGGSESQRLRERQRPDKGSSKQAQPLGPSQKLRCPELNRRPRFKWSNCSMRPSITGEPPAPEDKKFHQPPMLSPCPHHCHRSLRGILGFPPTKPGSCPPACTPSHEDQRMDTLVQSLLQTAPGHSRGQSSTPPRNEAFGDSEHHRIPHLSSGAPNPPTTTLPPAAWALEPSTSAHTKSRTHRALDCMVGPWVGQGCEAVPALAFIPDIQPCLLAVPPTFAQGGPRPPWGRRC